MNNIRKTFRSYQTLILTIAMIIFAGTGIFFGVVPLVRQSIDLFGVNATLSDEVASLRTKQQLLASLDEDALRTDLLALTVAVPGEKSLGTLFGGIDTVSGNTGVLLTEFTLLKAGSLATASAQKLNADEKEVNANILPFTITVSGTFDQIRSFLSTAVSVRRFFRVRSVEISFSDPTSVIAHVNMDAFFTPIPTSVGSVAAPATALTQEEIDTVAQVKSVEIAAAPSLSLPPPSTDSGRLDPFNP